MANKKKSGKSDINKSGTQQEEDIAPRILTSGFASFEGTESLSDEEPPLEIIVIGEDSPVDDKPPISDETPEDGESESDIAAHESLAVLQEQLAALEYSSVFEVLSDGPDEVLTKIHQFSQPMDNPPTQVFYEQAQARAASLTRFYTQLCSRGEPAMHAVLKLQVAEETSALGRSLSTGGTYNSWFSQGAISGYAHPDSAGSLFSPASYLTDLYRVSKPLHPAGNGLQLDMRRPDLRQLKLSDANLNDEISTLALTLEVLEAGVTGDVDQELLTKVYPMNLPYNHASEQIVQGMAACKSSLAELWSVLGDFEGKALKYETSLTGWTTRMPVKYARDALGISPELLKILTEPFSNDFDAVGKYYGKAHNNYMYFEHVMRDALQLPTETILEALGSGPFNEVPSADNMWEVDPSQIFIIAAEPRTQLTEMTVWVDRPSDIVWLSFVPVSLEVFPIHINSFQLRVNNLLPSNTDNTPRRAAAGEVLSFSTGMTMAQYFESSASITFSVFSGVIQYYFSDPVVIKEAVPQVVTPHTYGARYINGWGNGGNNFYWYIGAVLGQPVSPPVNNPADSLLYNRTNAAFGRLNRILRLQNHLKVLSFEELDWLICQASDDISVHPLTQPLQALAVYMPLRQRYGMTINSFGACLHLLNTFHAAGKSSFYTSLFGDDDGLINMRSVDFHQSTVNQSSLRARALLCQGLQIDDATLTMLAQYLPDIDATTRVLPVLGLTQISALYRLTAIPRLFDLSVAQALPLWDLLAAPEAIVRALAQPRPNLAALGVMIRTGYLVDWMHAAKLAPEQLIALTSRRYPTQSTPELQALVESIYSTLTGRVVGSLLQPADDEVLRAQLARHIGAEFNLKPNIAGAVMIWVDAAAKDMSPTLNGYDLLSFWADIELVCAGETTLDSLPRAVQYAYLLRQFAQVCHWAQFGEQDLHLLMPAGPAQPSALSGALTAPQLTLDVLLLLSRYRSWQRRLRGTAADALDFLQRTAAQDPALTLQVAAQVISDLHGWDLTQTLVLMNGAVPRSFVALLPLLQKIQFCQRLGLSPMDLSWVGKLTETATIDQATLTLIAAKVIAAAHV